MSQIVLGPTQGGEVDASVKKLVFSFLEKLAKDDTTPGLHIEPINGVVDDRVRTGRVNDFWRAVLVKLQGQGATAHYVYLGVYPHDQAIAFAKKARLTVNPVNGIAELILAGEAPAVETARRSSTSFTQPAPEVVAPEVVAPEVVAPEVVAPEVVAPEVVAPEVVAPEVVEPEVVEPLLTARGISREVLVDDIGISPDVADAALAATTEDQLIALAEGAVQWQGLVLLDLASGTSVEQAKAAVGIGALADVEVESDVAVGPTDDNLLSALQHPAALLQFAFIEDDDELRRAIEESSFAAWRVFLHPEQRKYATARYNGPFRLSGGAGTGKTVVLLHRARHLVRADPEARVLLTTFTKTLAESLRNDLKRLDPDIPLADAPGKPGVFVSGIDAAVSAVLKTANNRSAAIESILGARSPQIAGRTKDSVWQEAAEGGDSPAELRTKTFLASEYAMVVLPARVKTRDEYLTVRRPGRGVSLDRRKRAAVWATIESYRAQASIDGSVDFAEAASIAAASLDGSGTRPFDHVLVDEGQDLTPGHWQFLRALADERPDDLFIAEDSHQRIYGQRVVLGRYGIRIVGRSQRLTLNYRTTAENLGYAVGVLRGGDYRDLEDEQEQSSTYRSARSGPTPRVLTCGNVSEELDAAAEVVRQWAGNGDGQETIGLLVRDQHQARRLSVGLDERGIEVRVVDQGVSSSQQPLVMTMHRAKGMEFSRVLLFGVDEGLVPAEYVLRGLADADRGDAMLRERSLLYVAATRARDELVITSVRPSPILPT